MAKAEITVKAVAELDDESKQLLRDLRDRLPADLAVPFNPTKARQNSIKRRALEAVLVALDGWIEGVQENHDALQHRNCHRGEECWRQFSPNDIRNMINYAARELGIAEFPHPSVPKEDTK